MDLAVVSNPHMATGHDASVPVRLAIELEKRVVNPLVERLLRSRFHWLLSRHLAVLSYDGRISGTRVTTPLLYERDGEAFVVTTGRDEVTWWKNFREGYPATLRIAGEPIAVTGRAITDPDRLVPWLAELVDRSRLWRFLLRRYADRTGTEWSERALTAAAENLVAVRFRRRGATHEDASW
ncbi:nitroreductase/quinone reductase family protein [Natronolimnohabitans sp. A-GB9]|uniref:hypothetical protein n=1 Tax=Natronolimnohabitans sp. A-GB9 TaxID=3069757 RepID=UPI0027B04DAF|nr:hypothetical protein [Natronolimnohabitans sp. A-GB9]MDQ2050693.1 nitroreductase/quinone reductase family protein [Natronolimnohabitans sp. A-GB9]